MSQRSSGRTRLASLLATPPLPGVALSPAAAFVLSRADRDRLAIFDPSSASLLRPLIPAEAIQRWHVAPAETWALAIPAGYTAKLPGATDDEGAAFAALKARHPAIARHLAPHAPAAGHDGLWRELAATPAPGPRILVGAAGVAWDESEALVAAPALIIPGADPFWLALLGSRYGGSILRRADQADISPAEILEFPIPDAPAPLQANLGGLALSAASLARQLAEHERAVLRRLQADFAPPGAAPEPRLLRWWELSFAELRAALVDGWRNDIPERFRPTWEQIHARHCDDHKAAAERLAAIEAAIDSQVQSLL